ncbi:MAG TPA: hypothetical protein PLN21_13560 [Gemmatales bacterium]|nr:hypothetical protein [Gemmatales bacterium]
MATSQLSTKQQVFTEIIVGTLIYVVVLGFFRDYTDIVTANSFSTIFLAAFVLEVLTYLTFLLKKRIIAWLKDKPGVLYRVLMFFCVWLVMFLSKFLFIGVLDLLFSDYIYVHGFFGILFVVLCVTILHKLANYTVQKLGTPSDH